MKTPAPKTSAIAAALSHDALMGKSQAYIGRALAAKAAASMGEYQLWASLALELVIWPQVRGHNRLQQSPQEWHSARGALSGRR